MGVALRNSMGVALRNSMNQHRLWFVIFKGWSDTRFPQVNRIDFRE